MKSTKLSDVPFILQVYPIPDSEKILFMQNWSHYLSEREDSDTNFEEDLKKHSDFAGYYLADEFSVEKMGWDARDLSRSFNFKRISEKTAYNLGLTRANKIKFSLSGTLVLPSEISQLEELTKEKTSILKLTRGRGLANLGDLSRKNVDEVYTTFNKTSIPNFMFPFSLAGFNLTYANHGSGLDFYQDSSFLNGEYAKYLLREN